MNKKIMLFNCSLTEYSDGTDDLDTYSPKFEEFVNNEFIKKCKNYHPSIIPLVHEEHYRTPKEVLPVLVLDNTKFIPEKKNKIVQNLIDIMRPTNGTIPENTTIYITKIIKLDSEVTELMKKMCHMIIKFNDIDSTFKIIYTNLGNYYKYTDIRGLEKHVNGGNYYKKYVKYKQKYLKLKKQV
jgi:hypothetical protein